MAKANSTEVTGTVPTQIPSYIIDRDVLASAAGLDVDRRIIKSDLCVTWSGTESQFRATGLFSKLFKFMNYGNLHHGYIRFAALRVQEAGIITLTWREDVPQSLTRHEATNIEVCHYEDRVKYYGTPSELIEAGIIPRKMMPRGAKILRKIHLDSATKKYYDTLLTPNGNAVVEIHQLPHDAEAETTGEAPVKREKYVADLRYNFNLVMAIIVDDASGGKGWRLPECDYQKLIELKAHGDAIIANARPLSMSAPVLRLVKA